MSSKNVDRLSSPLTQDGLARDFVDKCQTTLRYDHVRGRWFRWNGAVWVEDRTLATFNDIREYIDLCTETHKLSMRKAAFARGVEQFALADQRISVTSEAWNSDRMLLGTPGGTVNLRDGSMKKADPADLISKCTSISPADTADCPRFLQFLDEVTGGDQEMLAYLQRLSGYAQTGETSEQILSFIYGPGGNGKSVFINIFKGISGSYTEVAAIETLTVSRFDSHPTGLAKLHGARAVVASETEEGRNWRVSLIKQLTGGDPISARYMRQDYFDFVPQFTLIVVGNHAPGFGAIDEAIKRRIQIVPFDKTPKVVDKSLEEKLKEEWPGILRWMIDGAVNWYREGLSPPQRVETATQEYLEQEYVFGQWLAECCEINAAGFVPVRNAFLSWKDFAHERNHDPGNERSFSPKMVKNGFVKTTKSVSRKSTKVWTGLNIVANR
ncbi:phage/plasmid primase, P4 family [Roseibium album]|uniref:SF3 helicase domain-containing protein n=1 Tax=Roseibium album TaxID=311410 RepID=A0A0M7ADA4_9HYPH|nr:phage/plasmid primase, P4 family [Roseibium album]CTQ63501.1 hypothetical protein LA5094_06300 [Roseibium album]CTQ63677.1 hypothetical protein LA5095_00009 [Roseibium album]CTQ72200.1 hypothetical protein LA5096_03150 [Roseibium album]